MTNKFFASQVTINNILCKGPVKTMKIRNLKFIQIFKRYFLKSKYSKNLSIFGNIKTYNKMPNSKVSIIDDLAEEIGAPLRDEY